VTEFGGGMTDYRERDYHQHAISMSPFFTSLTRKKRETHLNSVGSGRNYFKTWKYVHVGNMRFKILLIMIFLGMCW
jgi:hypothetical protein